MSSEKDLDLWAVEDAAEAVGVTRQRLNELLRSGRYPCVVIPYRNPDGSQKIPDHEGARARSVRYRLVEGKIIKKIRKEREAAQDKQADMEAEAEKRRTQKKKRGRPRKTPLLDKAKQGMKLPSIKDLPI